MSSLKIQNISVLTLGSNLLLFAVIGYLLGVIFWQIFYPSNKTENSITLDSIFIQKESTKTKQRRVSELHLFGKQEGKAQEQQVIKRTIAPISRLNLNLNGIFASTPDRESLAIISSGSNDELLYAIGDNLPGGAQLKEVYEDKVIIDRNGSLETLELPRDNVSIAEQNDANTVAQNDSSDSSPELTPKKLRSDIFKDFSQLPDMLGITPEYKNGKILGYRVKIKKHKELFSKYGVQETDIITVVNGISLEPSNSFKILQQLKNATIINLSILRNGQRQSISIPL